MVFSSLIFVFGFLPFCIIGGFITRKNIQIQNVFLLIMSLLFYAWGEPKLIALFVATIFINWFLVLLSSKNKSLKLRTGIGIFTICIDLGILFWFKYASWIFNGINALSGFSKAFPEVILPIGISFYTFQAIAYVVDVTMFGKYEAQKNPINVGLYIAFFPQLIAGPIVRYEDIAEKINNRKMSLEEFSQGVYRFIVGFCKKVLLADSLAVIVNHAFEMLPEGNLTTSFAWLGAIAYALQIFLDFSAYSDMAIGLGHMFGFTIRENFNKPYKAKTIRDFWRRWHMSLSYWFRDYVYIPLGGNKKSEIRTYINLAVVWLITGIWHGADLTFVFWGILYGALIIVERRLNIESWIEKRISIKSLYRCFTLLMILLLWVIFRADSLRVAAAYISCMFSFEEIKNGLWTTIFYLSEFKVEFLVTLIICFYPDISEEKQTVLRDFSWPIMIGLFICGVSYLVKGTFSPFLYFNF